MVNGVTTKSKECATKCQHSIEKVSSKCLHTVNEASTKRQHIVNLLNIAPKWCEPAKHSAKGCQQSAPTKCL